MQRMQRKPAEAPGILIVRKQSSSTVEKLSYYELHRSEKSKGAMRNSGGIIVYIRNTLLIDSDIKHSIVLTYKDSHVWFKLDKSLLLTRICMYAYVI